MTVQTRPTLSVDRSGRFLDLTENDLNGHTLTTDRFAHGMSCPLSQVSTTFNMDDLPAVGFSQILAGARGSVPGWRFTMVSLAVDLQEDFVPRKGEVVHEPAQREVLPEVKVLAAERRSYPVFGRRVRALGRVNHFLSTTVTDEPALVLDELPLPRVEGS